MKQNEHVNYEESFSQEEVGFLDSTSSHGATPDSTT